MRYLVQTTEVYRADTEAEAQGLITEAKSASEYTLSKYTSEMKEIKAKGEIIDTYWKVSLVKLFADIKEPTEVVTITYEVDQ